MSFSEVLAELPTLTVLERQTLIRQAIELDDLGPSAEDEALLAQRLAEHRTNPASAVSLEEMKGRLRAQFAK